MIIAVTQDPRRDQDIVIMTIVVEMLTLLLRLMIQMICHHPLIPAVLLRPRGRLPKTAHATEKVEEDVDNMRQSQLSPKIRERCLYPNL